jgi:hypothetical protein
MGSPVQAAGKFYGLTPGISSPQRVAAVLGKLQGTRLGPAMREAVNASDAKMHTKALDVLLTRVAGRNLKEMDEFLGDQGLTVEQPLGAGWESVVFGATPRSGPDRHVVKIAVRDEMHRPDHAFDLPDIPGVAAYWSRGNFGPLAVGVQRRAVPLNDPAISDYYGQQMLSRLSDSLHSRGLVWGDALKQNAGILDGEAVVFDGAVFPGRSIGAPKYATPEEAIRALRMTPSEMRVIGQ